MERNLRKLIVVIYMTLISLLYIQIIPLTMAQGTLEITLYTNKPEYFLGDTLNIYGYVYNNGSLVSDALVGLEVDDPTNHELILRTLQIGVAPTNQEIEIISAYPSDQWGKPKDSFKRGEFAYFNITVRNNNDTEAKNFLITLTAFDSAQGIIDSSWVRLTLNPLCKVSVIIPIYILEKAATGKAIVYANTFNELPKNGGTPLSIEKSTTFTITSSSSSYATSSGTISSTPGLYYTTFKVPLYQPIGTYTIYATCKYANQVTAAQKTVIFKVPDLNNDNKVNVLDLIIVSRDIGWEGPPGGIISDLNKDGKVNILDIILVARSLGWEA
jgi:hypothetical protein